MSKDLIRKDWDSGSALREYAPCVSERFQNVADEMRAELRNQYLDVTLVPAPDPKFTGHKIRVAVNSNPGWYRDLWHEYAKVRAKKGRLRKTTSSIGRSRINKALSEISEGNDRPYREETRGCVPYAHHYVTIIRDLIFSRLTDGYVRHEEANAPPEYVDADAFVRWYFKLDDRLMQCEA